MNRVAVLARRHGHVTAAVVMLACTAGFFSPVLVDGRDFSTVAGHQAHLYPWRAASDGAGAVVVQSDHAALSLPWQVELNRRVGEGTLPFWSRTSFLGGYPLFSNSNAGQLYPPHLVPALLGWSAHTTHHVFSALHLFLSGWCCYWFLRELRRSWWASVLGGVAWMLSSFNLGWLHFEAVVPLQALLPAALALVVRAHRRRTVASAVAAGAMLGLTMVSGHVLWMGITCLVAGGYAAALAIGDVRGVRAAGGRARRRALAAAVRAPAIAAVVAAGLAAVVLLPTAHTLATAYRSAFSYADLYATEFVLGGRQLAPPTVVYRWFVPWREAIDAGTINTHLLFAGTLTAVLAIVGALQRRVQGVGFGRVVVGFFVLAAIGGPVTWAAYHLVPVFRVFRPYGRLLQWATIGLVVLAAIGFDAALGAYTARTRGRTVPPVLRPPVLAALVVTVTAVQLLAVGRELNEDTFPPADAALRFPSTGLTDALEELRDDGPWPARSIPVSHRGVIPFTLGNHHLVFDVDTVGGYDSVLPARNHRMLQYLSGGAADDEHAAAAYVPVFQLGTVRYELLSRLGIGAVITGPLASVKEEWGRTARAALELRPRYRGDDGALFTTGDDVGPRVVRRVRAVADDDEAFATFVDADFDWRNEVVLEPAAVDRLTDAGALPAGGDVDADVEVTAFGANTLELVVRSDAPGLLVLPVTWDPGWRATVDGAPVPVVRGNYLQRVVPVPAGASRVELRYLPEGFVTGAAVSGLTAIGALGAVVVERTRHRERGRHVRRARRSDGLEDELVGEERRTGPEAGAFDAGGSSGQAAADGVERDADGDLAADGEPARPHEPTQRPP